MVQRIRNLRLAELLDPACPALRVATGGDVPAAVHADHEHLLRTLASLPAGSVSAGIQFLYTPTSPNPQDRLSVSLVGHAAHQ